MSDKSLPRFFLPRWLAPGDPEPVRAMQVPHHGPDAPAGGSSEAAAEEARMPHRARRPSTEQLIRNMGGDEAWQRNAGALGAVAMVARIGSNYRWHLARRKPDKTLEKIDPAGFQRGAEAGLARLLRKPNKHQTRTQFLNTVFSNLEAYGNVYIWIKRTYFQQKLALVELWVLNGRAVTVRFDRSGRKEYRYYSRVVENDQGWVPGIPTGPDGRPYTVPSSEVVYTASSSLATDGSYSRPLPGKEPDNAGHVYLAESEVIHVTNQSISPLRGVNPTAQASRLFATLNAIEINNLEHAASGGMKPLVIGMSNPDTPQEKIDDTRAALLQRDPMSHRDILLASAEVSVSEHGTGIDKMGDVKEMGDVDTGRLTGLPAMYNQVQGPEGSSKSAEEMTKILRQQTIEPMQNALGEALVDALIPQAHTMADPVEVVWEYDPLKMAGLTAITQHVVDFVQSGIYSPNDALRLLGMPTRKDGAANKYADPSATPLNQSGRPQRDGNDRSETEKSRNNKKGGSPTGPRK